MNRAPDHVLVPETLTAVDFQVYVGDGEVYLWENLRPTPHHRPERPDFYPSHVPDPNFNGLHRDDTSDDSISGPPSTRDPGPF